MEGCRKSEGEDGDEAGAMWPVSGIHVSTASNRHRYMLYRVGGG